MQLIMVRHGETSWNAVRRMQGQANSPLTNRGRSQARQLVPYFAETWAPDHVMTSDLDRTKDTATEMGFLFAERHVALREIHVGDWSGYTSDQIDPAVRTQWIEARFTPPNGESWWDFKDRVKEALQNLDPAKGQRQLLVTHGLWIKAAACVLLDISHMDVYGPRNCSITEFHLNETRTKGRLMRYDDVHWREDVIASSGGEIA